LLNAQTTLKGAKLKINSKDFLVPSRKKVELDEWPTAAGRFFKSNEEYQDLLETHVQGLSSR